MWGESSPVFSLKFNARAGPRPDDQLASGVQHRMGRGEC
jgi:hypothetical protein